MYERKLPYYVWVVSFIYLVDCIIEVDFVSYALYHC